jgi:hypothetical protein
MYTILCSKAAIMWMRAPEAGHSTQLPYALLWVMVALVLITAVWSMHYLQMALQAFDSSLTIPTFFTMFTLCCVIGAALAAPLARMLGPATEKFGMNVAKDFLKNFAREKVEKVKKFLDHATEAQVVLGYLGWIVAPRSAALRLASASATRLRGIPAARLAGLAGHGRMRSTQELTCGSCWFHRSWWRPWAAPAPWCS